MLDLGIAYSSEGSLMCKVMWTDTMLRWFNQNFVYLLAWTADRGRYKWYCCIQCILPACLGGELVKLLYVCSCSTTFCTMPHRTKTWLVSAKTDTQWQLCVLTNLCRASNGHWDVLTSVRTGSDEKSKLWLVMLRKGKPCTLLLLAVGHRQQVSRL